MIEDIIDFRLAAYKIREFAYSIENVSVNHAKRLVSELLKFLDRLTKRIRNSDSLVFMMRRQRNLALKTLWIMRLRFFIPKSKRMISRFLLTLKQEAMWLFDKLMGILWRY